MQLQLLVLGLALGQTALREIDRALGNCHGIDILELTIDQAHGHFQAGRLRPSQLVGCYLVRIEQMNPFLNAVIQTNPDAMAIALALDTAPTGQPLYGIPILIKDNIGTSDAMETTAGCVALVGARPKRDAEVVRRLRRLGAVILGKTNLSEMAG